MALLINPPYFFCLLAMLRVANPRENMYIVWGAPNGGVPLKLSNITDWAACVQFCYDSKYCVVAYNGAYNLNTETCTIYDYFTLGSVIQYTNTSAKGAKVAFKLEMEDKSKCQIDDNPPTFEKNYAAGGVSVPSNASLKLTYNVTLTDGIWSILYNVRSYCYNISTISFRGDVAICIVFFKSDSFMTLELGESSCKGFNNGSIGGIEDVWQEYSFSYVFSNPSGVNKERVVWLDGRRRSECQRADWNTLPACDKFKAFNFSDPYHITTDMYTWEDGAPFGKECLVMWASSVSNPSRAGKVRDIDCNTPCSTSICPIGVTCWSATI